MIEIPDVVAKIEEEVGKKIKRYACHTTRASSIGYAVPMLNGCERRGVYERTHWEEKELFEVGSQFIFDEGHLQEKAVLRSMEDAGYTITTPDTSFAYKKNNVTLATGSIDGSLVVEEDGAGHITKAIPFEIKSMHPMIYDTMFTFADFKKKWWTHAYMAQITMYMLMKEIDQAIFFLKNKSNGRIRQINVELDYELGEACLKTADNIQEHVVAGTQPDRIDDRDVCARCPFRHICLPELSFGTELKIADDPSFESKLKRYSEINDTKKEAEKLWKEQIRPKAMASAEEGNLNLNVGDFLLTGKTNAKGTFTLKMETI